MAERRKACEQAVTDLAIKMKMRPLTRRVALAAVPLSLAAIALPIFSNTVGAENGVTPAVTPAVTPQAPLFTECPAIGHDTGCQFLITLPASGPATITEDKNQGPYDGSDDTLVGIVNDTAVPIPSVNLSSTNDIFHFDGDGICSHGFTPFVGSGYCTNGNVTTGYEGPINTFSGYTSSDGYTTGVVNFDALAPGASTFFSLESSLSGVSFIIPADFSVTKSVTSPGPYYAGDASTPITYRLAAHNFGGVSGPVQIQDTVPTGTTLVTGSDACPTGISPATCSVSLAGSTITWNLFDVGNGVTIDVGFSVTPNASTSNYSVSNTAVWDGPGCATDPNGPPPIVTESAAVTPDVAADQVPDQHHDDPRDGANPVGDHGVEHDERVRHGRTRRHPHLHRPDGRRHATEDASHVHNRAAGHRHDCCRDVHRGQQVLGSGGSEVHHHVRQRERGRHPGATGHHRIERERDRRRGSPDHHGRLQGLRQR